MTVELLLTQSSVCANPELASEHHVECVGSGATRLVAELDPGDLFLLAGVCPIALAHDASHELAEVDRILDKISDHGEDALTDEERKTLLRKAKKKPGGHA